MEEAKKLTQAERVAEFLKRLGEARPAGRMMRHLVW
jgi:hypothetical protein